MTKKEIAAFVKNNAEKFKGLSAEDLKAQLIADEVTEKDADKIVAEFFDTGDDSDDEESKEFDLSKFDYRNLTGESFKKYVDLVGDRSVTVIDEETGKETMGRSGKLKENDMYVFVCHKVDVIMKIRYLGVKDSPQDFNGVKIKTDRPEHATKMPIKTAHELNAQILNAHSRAGHGKYYLLKK